MPPLAWGDVMRWEPESIRGVKAAVTKRGATAQEVADALGRLPLFATWEGQSGTAAKESLDRLAKYLVEHADEMTALAVALDPAADAVKKVRDELGKVQVKADGWHIEIDPMTSAVTPTAAALNGSSPSELLFRVAQLQSDVKQVLAMAELVDQDLARAISDGKRMPGSLTHTLESMVPKPLPPEMHPTSSEQNFTKAEDFIYDEMMKNLKSPKFLAMKKQFEEGLLLHPLDTADAYKAFYDLVQTDGPWDHKPMIRDLVGIQKGDGLYFQQPGTDRQVYYDLYSNVHYGYMGRAAGIPPALLEAIPNIPTGPTGVNDASDDLYVAAGIAMYDKYGPNMTATQFHQGLTDLINQLDAAQQSGQNITMKHGYK